MTAPDIINRVSMRDRATADRLILQYIAELRKFQLSSANQSDIRARYILHSLMNPYTPFDPYSGKQPERIPPPGPEVMRAYVTYMLEAYAGLEQREPGYMRMWRRPFLSLWIPLQRYAPDLAPVFLNLEARSRLPEQSLSLPTAADEKEAERSQLGFDLAVIKKLAPGNEERVQQAAYALRNRVQRVLALAALYQWKAEKLTAKQAALKP